MHTEIETRQRKNTFFLLCNEVNAYQLNKIIVCKFYDTNTLDLSNSFSAIFLSVLAI